MVVDRGSVRRLTVEQLTVALRCCYSVSMPHRDELYELKQKK